jgi:hypothetical protein
MESQGSSDAILLTSDAARILAPGHENKGAPSSPRNPSSPCSLHRKAQLAATRHFDTFWRRRSDGAPLRWSQVQLPTPVQTSLQNQIIYTKVRATAASALTSCTVTHLHLKPQLFLDHQRCKSGLGSGERADSSMLDLHMHCAGNPAASAGGVERINDVFTLVSSDRRSAGLG